MTTIATRSSQYIYSFVNAQDADAIHALGLRGLNDEQIHVTVVGNLGITVSDLVETRIRPQRKLLAAHQNVVTEIAKRFSSLPVAFGLVADDNEGVNRVVLQNETVLREQLQRVAGKVEMFLNIQWTAENIFQYFIERFPELAAARDHIVSGRATRDEQIELGRQFEYLLKSERDRYTNDVQTALSDSVVEWDTQSPKSEVDVVRMACLIRREDEEVYTQGIYRAATKFNEDFRFAYNGPWPPYSFVKLALSME